MRLLCASLSAALLVAPMAGAEQCTLTKLTSFDANLSSGRIMVDALIDGQPVSAMLNTGLPFNMISRALVAKLKLSTAPAPGDASVQGLSQAMNSLSTPTLPPEDNRMADVTGEIPKEVTEAHNVAFGDIKTDHTPFFVMDDSGKSGSRPDVIFGANFLETYDLEFDLAHGKVNIFFPNHCPGQVVYWAHKFAAVSIRILINGRISLPVAVNGVDTHAILDTGAELSMVGTQLAKSALHIDPGMGDDQAEYATGYTGERLPFYLHTFDRFDFAGVQFNNTAMGIAPDRMNRRFLNAVNDPHAALRQGETINAPVTLGMSHLKKLRLYLSFQERMLYVTTAYADLAAN
jgi:predicted aspartyl protease